MRRRGGLAIALVSALVMLLLTLHGAGQAATATRQGPEQAPVAVRVWLQIDNVYGFSPQHKTYSVEGRVGIAAPAPEMRHWLAAGVDPIQLVHFDNLVQPWDSLIEPTSGPIQSTSHGQELLGRHYRFNGLFYSDQINFRSYPFGRLPLQVRLVADPSFPATLAEPPPLKLLADRRHSGVGERSQMNGYALRRWQLLERGGAVELQLVYQPIGGAALVKWLLPLAITMVILLLAANLRSNLSSERLAIPPVILLTLVFMQQAYRESLPSLPYLTSLDGLYAFSYLVTLAFFCEFIWCANRVDQGGSSLPKPLLKRAERLESGLQLASLGGYGLLLLWAWSQA